MFTVYVQIIPDKCKYEVLSTKIEIRLAKADIITWASLEHGKGPAVLPKPNISSGFLPFLSLVSSDELNNSLLSCKSYVVCMMMQRFRRGQLIHLLRKLRTGTSSKLKWRNRSVSYHKSLDQTYLFFLFFLFDCGRFAGKGWEAGRRRSFEQILPWDIPECGWGYKASDEQIICE